MAGFNFGGGDSNYTGILTRSIVFSGAMLAFLGSKLHTVYSAANVPCQVLTVFFAAFGMSLASIIIPEWISFDSTSVCATHHLQRIHTDSVHKDSGNDLRYTYGLHRRCSSTTHTCVKFPAYEDCMGSDVNFCSMWQSAGFLMSFAIVLEGMTIAAFLVLLFGGKQKREAGWGVLCLLVVVSAVVQAGSMSLIVHLPSTYPTSTFTDTRCSRHTYSTTTHDSFPGGSSTSHGFYVRSAG